jgi:hypothetical protein
VLPAFPSSALIAGSRLQHERVFAHVRAKVMELNSREPEPPAVWVRDPKEHPVKKATGRRTPVGGWRSFDGATPRRRHRGTLDSVSVYTTAADRSGRRLIDAAIAVAAFAATVALASHGTAFADETRVVDSVTVVLAALASLPLAVWRRSPLGVFALTTAASAVLSAVGAAAGPPFGPTIALYLLDVGPEQVGSGDRGPSSRAW